MKDLTLLYYSAHTLPQVCEINIRNELIKLVSGRYPIVSVTQKPINLGTNICVRNIGRSHDDALKKRLWE